MADQLGASFAPTFDNAELAKRGAAPGGGAFPQGAIQVLNYRLPSVAGAAGIPGSISPLVGDRPSGGFGSAVLQSVLHTVLGPDAAAAFTAAGPGADDSFARSLRREHDLNPRSEGPTPGAPPAQPYPTPTPGAPRGGGGSPFPDDTPPPSPGPVVVRPGGEKPGGGDGASTPAATPFDDTPAQPSWHDRKGAYYRGDESAL